jgi:hypothetical protein
MLCPKPGAGEEDRQRHSRVFGDTFMRIASSGTAMHSHALIAPMFISPAWFSSPNNQDREYQLSPVNHHRLFQLTTRMPVQRTRAPAARRSFTRSFYFREGEICEKWSDKCLGMNLPQVLRGEEGCSRTKRQCQINSEG